MKKRIWLLLVILVAILVMGIKGFFGQPEMVTVVDSMPMEKPQILPKSKKRESALLVSTDRLLTHLQKLNFQRFTTQERSRTRTYITNELKKFGWKPQLEKFSDGINIFAERRGTDKAAGAILVAAHYDTVEASPGADDNASGVAVVLEIARLLGSRSTPETLQLAFFDKEEAGLLGSRAYVAQAAHLQNLRGAIIMDMVSYACYTVGCQKYPEGLSVTPPSKKGDFLAAVGDVEHSFLLNAFKQEKRQSNLPAVLTLPIPFKGLLTPDVLRSDHAPFWYQGIGAVLVTDTADLRTPHYHQSSDLPKNIERSFFTGSAQIIVNATTILLENSNILLTQPST